MIQTYQYREAYVGIDFVLISGFDEEFNPKLENSLFWSNMFGIAGLLAETINQRYVANGGFQVPIWWFKLKHTLSSLNSLGIIFSKHGYFEECGNIPVFG